MLYTWNVIGHEKELSQLEQNIKSGNIHHAYLFVGPEKIGKFRVAKSLAGILQCPNNFCHTCPTCVQIEKKCHPDTIELEDDGESIKINIVRDIIARLNMTGQSRHKIVLIQDIGRLTEAPALLKTIEEPPEKTIFIFTAGQLRDIMPTIASRMRILHFKKLPDEILREALKEQFPAADDETLDQVLLLSLGRSGKAIQLLSSPEIFQELRDLYRHIQFLDEKASPAARLMAMHLLYQDPRKTKTFMSLLIHYFRRKMFAEKTHAGRLDAIRILINTHKTLNLYDRNINQRLLLENLMLQL